MKVSIIIPIYNSAQYLTECLESVVGQTWRDIEIILIDDGSTDDSASICKKYLLDNRVRYYYQKNAGVSIARNTGIQYATGDYICFVDSDDWLELDAVERLQNETADIVIYNFYHGEKKHQMILKNGVYSKEEIFPEMISFIDENGNVGYMFHNVWMRLFKRKLLEDNDIRFRPQYRNGEDLVFTMEATMKATIVAVRSNEYLYHYRLVQNSLTSSYVVDYWKYRKDIIAELYELIQSDILYEQMPLRIFLWVVTGIENELKHNKGNKGNIQAIISDSVCDSFRNKLDVLRLNDRNKFLYEKICEKDANKILGDYKAKSRRKKYRKFIKKCKCIIRKII